MKSKTTMTLEEEVTIKTLDALAQEYSFRSIGLGQDTDTARIFYQKARKIADVIEMITGEEYEL